MLVSTSPLERVVRLPPWIQSQTITAVFPSSTAQMSEPTATRRETPVAADRGRDRACSLISRVDQPPVRGE
jgi:hypothetical protein